MNKSELAAAVAAEVDCSNAQAARVLDCAIRLVGEALASGAEVKIHGLGSFRSRPLGPRSGKGPDGRPYSVPARAGIEYRASNSLLAMLPDPAAGTPA